MTVNINDSFVTNNGSSNEPSIVDFKKLCDTLTNLAIECTDFSADAGLQRYKVTKRGEILVIEHSSHKFTDSIWITLFHTSDNRKAVRLQFIDSGLTIFRENIGPNPSNDSDYNFGHTEFWDNVIDGSIESVVKSYKSHQIFDFLSSFEKNMCNDLEKLKANYKGPSSIDRVLYDFDVREMSVEELKATEELKNVTIGWEYSDETTEVMDKLWGAVNYMLNQGVGFVNSKINVSKDEIYKRKQGILKEQTFLSNLSDSQEDIKKNKM